MSNREMVINYVPGEECRVAIVEDGKLEDYHAERMDGPSSHVGNIYVGKVINVEQAIQAAFVDFGLEANGFLHVSDVHPQYFPGQDQETTERVGKKTPRRERPPIQDCFRRGDEVAVQVLKEGVGTKGPTVTSYLSIPGRFLVMMPQMDKVGVSRKVEDEETRRKMREILDQLDLPEGFGFILRTAGMERTKAELKRDLAYLMRLWKDMERRWRAGNKPRLLYSESDLLVRALRDLLTGEIDRIVVDNEAALNRAARFLKIVAPRTSTQLVHYTGKAPIFHVMGIEQQIQMIHAREVPLPSGGRLVIDETEALVAIDVNSGRSRDARDAESNAFNTNMEAVDEICRQLRLRDLGGVIVNDLIDMRSAKHRRDVEARFKDNLKKDRARWTTAPISEFGVLEMTRQRMRGSHESQHFSDCPTCRGRGLVQRPDSVAGDSLREMTAMLDSEGVARVEMVVHPRIAGELLSSKRRALSRIERSSGKRVDVRVSEAIPVDRVSFYAYDDRGADLDVSRLGGRRVREDELVAYEIAADAADDWASQADEPEAVEPEPVEEFAEIEPHPIELEPAELDRGEEPHGDDRGEEGGRRRRRRRRRGGRGRGRGGMDGHQEMGADDAANAPPPEEQEPRPADQDHAEGADSHQHDQFANGTLPHGQDEQQGDGRRRRRRRRRGRGGRGGEPGSGEAAGQHAEFPPRGGHDHSDEHAPHGDGPYSTEAGPADGEYSGDEHGHGETGRSAAHTDGSHGDGQDEYGASVDGREQSESGVGGPRRRRRRRRGRGGSDRGGAEGQDQRAERPNQPQGSPRHGQPPQQGGRPARQGQAGAGSLAAMFQSSQESEGGNRGGETHDQDGGDDARGHDVEGGMDEHAREGGRGDEDRGEDGGQPRRRRRRRRGRGGSRGPDGSSGSGESGQDQGASSEQRRTQAPRDTAPRHAQPPQKPQPPASPPPAQPKVRTLYSSRRRLAPGDMKNLKRED